jgi:hypothetical protein
MSVSLGRCGCSFTSTAWSFTGGPRRLSVQRVHERLRYSLVKPLSRLEQEASLASFDTPNNAINRVIRINKAPVCALSIRHFRNAIKEIQGLQPDMPLQPAWINDVACHLSAISQATKQGVYDARHSLPSVTLQRHNVCPDAWYFCSNGVIGAALANGSQCTSRAVNCVTALANSSI